MHILFKTTYLYEFKKQQLMFTTGFYVVCGGLIYDTTFDQKYYYHGYKEKEGDGGFLKRLHMRTFSQKAGIRDVIIHTVFFI